jgi:hypothetical protein
VLVADTGEFMLSQEISGGRSLRRSSPSQQCSANGKRRRRSYADLLLKPQSHKMLPYLGISVVRTLLESEGHFTLVSKT